MSLYKKVKGWADGVLVAEARVGSRLRRLLVRQLKLYIHVTRDILSGHYQQRAAALAFTTVLALIPLVTVSFSLFKAFGGLAEEDVQGLVRKHVIAFLSPSRRASWSEPPPAADPTFRAFEWPLSALDHSQESWQKRWPKCPKWWNNRVIVFMPQPLLATGALGHELPTDRETADRRANAILADWTNRISKYVVDLSSKASSAQMNVLGVLLLFVTSVLLFHNVESSFNQIWHVTRRRAFHVKFAAFCTILLLGPLLIAVSIYLTAKLKPILDYLPGGQVIPRISVFVVPLVITWAAFFLAYVLMPNTRVHWRPALAGALVGGTIWELAKWGFGIFVAHAVAYSKVYGPLAVFPIFLLWLYLSWVIVLFGAGVAYTWQNLPLLTAQRRRASRQVAGSEYLALLLMLLVARRFRQGRPPLTFAELAGETDATEEEVAAAAVPLRQAGLLVAVGGEEPAVHPAKPLEKITVAHVFQAVRRANARGFRSLPDCWKDLVDKLFSAAPADDTVLSQQTLHALAAREAGAGPRPEQPPKGPPHTRIPEAGSQEP